MIVCIMKQETKVMMGFGFLAVTYILVIIGVIIGFLFFIKWLFF